MARDFLINGETLVSVKGGEHMSGFPIAELSELGLAVGPIRVTPRFYHRDLYVDDFGPDVPFDVMTKIADVTIRMSLVHTDADVMDICMAESLGGADLRPAPIGPNFVDGVLPPAGTLLGGLIEPLASGCHFISLNLTSPVLNVPWRFPCSYLTSQPLEIPLGTTTSVWEMEWRAIPYYYPAAISNSGVFIPGEILSSGRILWDHTPDT